MTSDKKNIWNTVAAVTKCVKTKNCSIYLSFLAPKIAKRVKPGQFVYIKTSGLAEPLLRRAFSVMDTNRESGVVHLYIDIKGPGTQSLANLIEGDSIDVMGPLGHGFQKKSYRKENILIGGGCGVAPLIMLAKELKSLGKNVRFYYGGRNREQLTFTAMLKKTVDTLIITTDDGSFGKKGLITNFLDISADAAIFSCGPKPMLKALSVIAPNANVALETEMACGIGVCMGCTVPMAAGGYKRCCTEGPVFRASEVAWI
jgi:dihydroorotate dehydrogenase electron transfer subunit